MGTATLIVGLPGSGKSHLAERIASLDATANTVIFDDMKMSDLEQARDTIKSGRNIVLTHPQLCVTSIRETAKITIEAWGGEVDFLYFTNDPDACLANVKRRNDGRKVEMFIRDLSKDYKIPDDAGIMICRVWRPE